MFCIKSDVITLGSIEMYSHVTIWTSMDDGPYWVTLLKYGSHGMRYTGFRRLTVVNRTPGFWGVTCVVLTQAGLSGLSPNYFRELARPDLWPGMANMCYCCKLNNMLNV